MNIFSDNSEVSTPFYCEPYNIYCVSFDMANPDISRKLLKIFEGLVNSCCQHYQLLSKKDQLEADQIVRDAFPCLKVKQEDAIKEEREYFEDDGDLKVKEEAIFPEITEAVSYTHLTLPTTPYV